MDTQRLAWIGLGGLVTTLGACQLVSGLSGYRESGGSGGNGATSSSGTGGATTSSTTSSSGTGGSGGMGNDCDGGVHCSGTISCVDLSTDPNHCGTCKLACPTAFPSCIGGACLPEIVGGPYEAVTALTARPSSKGAYWAYGQSSSHLTGRSSVDDVLTPLAAPLVLGLTVTVQDGALLAVTATEIYKLGNAGVTLMPFFADPMTDVTYTGAVSANHSVNQSQLVVAGHTATQEVVRVVDLANPSLTAISTSVVPPIFATDDAYVYWTNSKTEIDALSASVLSSPMTVTDLSRTYLAADRDPASSGYLYWIAPPKLQRAPKVFMGMPAAEQTSTTSIVAAKGLVVDGEGNTTQVYWLEDAGACASPEGTLFKMGWNDVSPTPIADKLPCPRNLALDSTYLYFSAGDTDAVNVFRVPK